MNEKADLGFKVLTKGNSKTEKIVLHTPYSKARWGPPPKMRIIHDNEQPRFLKTQPKKVGVYFYRNIARIPPQTF